ncbi:MAG: hypothetical protein L0Z73_00450 [Gammaproteobacteria bacterium]|nr:hypothetical protein [Gammaproteobacteria bacterium]
MISANKNILGWSAVFSLAVATWPPAVNAACAAEREKIYRLFIDYREQINTASRLEDLIPYFSDNFNGYFSNKLESARSESAKSRYLAQYWDNLNTARDIVIVFDYSLKCINDNARLTLVSVLSSNGVNEGQEVELWTVTINYLAENQQWKIDSFEYKKLGPDQKYLATGIKNNFLKIR